MVAIRCGSIPNRAAFLTMKWIASRQSASWSIDEMPSCVPCGISRYSIEMQKMPASLSASTISIPPEVMTTNRLPAPQPPPWM